MEAREVVDGGAYGVELVEELVWDRWGLFRGIRGLEGCGGEVVEREDVGGYHGHEEEQV